MTTVQRSPADLDRAAGRRLSSLLDAARRNASAVTPSRRSGRRTHPPPETSQRRSAQQRRHVHGTATRSPACSPSTTSHDGRIGAYCGSGVPRPSPSRHSPRRDIRPRCFPARGRNGARTPPARLHAGTSNPVLRNRFVSQHLRQCGYRGDRVGRPAWFFRSRRFSRELVRPLSTPTQALVSLF